MMKNRWRIFTNPGSCAGGMLVELLMSVALAALIIPFLFRYQHNAVVRAQNIAVVNQMTDIQAALERYINDNRTRLMNTVGKSITRVEIDALAPYGIEETVMDNADKYQLRILKSSDSTGQATLQGVIVFTDADITPLRTREIVAMGGNSLGFIDGTRAYGTFGAWHADTVDLGIPANDGIVATTLVSRDNAMYLWRVPSLNADDATMMSALNLGGHDIVNASFLNAMNAGFDETLHVGQGVVNNLIFQNRTTIDSNYQTQNATVSGILSADSRNMDVAGTLTLADLGKFTAFNAFDLWATNMTLAGLSIADTGQPAILNINQTLDMTGGRIDAIYVTVSFTGSITPRLNVRYRVEDSTNPSFYWDAMSGTAHFMDAIFAELRSMGPRVVRMDGANGNTSAAKTFSAVAANPNATIGDYMNAIQSIQSSVRAKYSRLNLE